MRRAKLAAVPGNPPGIAASNGSTSTVSAPPTPAPNAATVVRSMFTHGSRCAIIGIDVTACTRAAPSSGSPTTSATLAHSRRSTRSLGDGHELVVVCGQPEADLPQRIRHAEPGLAEQAADRRRPRRRHPASSHDALAPRLCSAGPSTVIARTPPAYPVTFAAIATTSAMSAAGRLLNGAVSGSAPRSIDSRARCSSSMSVSCGSSASAAATKSAADVEHHRHQVEKHALEQAVQLGGRDAVGRAHPQHQRADTFGQRHQHRAVAVGDGLLARRGKRFGDLPSRLDVAQRVAAADERPVARQRRLRRAVQAGVQRPDREALIGRRIQQASRAPAAGRPDRAGSTSPTRPQRPSASAVCDSCKPDSCTSIRLNDHYRRSVRRAADARPAWGELSTARPVVLVGVKSVVSTLAALRAAVIWTAKQVPRRQLAAIAATIVILVAILLLVPRPGAMAATGLGDVGGPVVPAGLPGRTHRRHGVSVPAHRVHAGLGPSCSAPGSASPSRSSPARSAHCSRCCWSAPPAGGSTASSPIRGSRPSTPGCASAAGRR